MKMKSNPLFLNLISFSFIAINYPEIIDSSSITSRIVSCPNFGRKTKDVFLNASIFVTFTVELEIHCLHKCLVDDRCISYNYGPHGDRFSCDLSSTDRFSDKDNFVSKAGYIHRGIVVGVLQHGSCNQCEGA